MEKRTVPSWIIVPAKGLLGLAFIVFGANGFLDFLPAPPQQVSAAGVSFLGALKSTGYMSVVMALQIVGGIFVLSGRLAPLGLLILGPILFNILLYGLFMSPGGLPLVLVLIALALLVGWRHRDFFTPFFRIREDHCTFKGG